MATDPPTPQLAPTGLLVVADTGLDTRDDGRVLVGGDPLRVIRLTDSGAARVAGWLRGAPIGSGHSERALAARLLGIGLVHPVVEPALLDDVTVVVPVRDDREGAATVVTGLGGLASVIVDDCSAVPLEDSDLASRPGVRVVRLDVSGGPGAARMVGLSLVETGLVAFVDADVRVARSDLEALVGYFSDPGVGAVAPRVVGDAGSGPWAAYDESFGPLDLGSEPGPVGPGRRVPYVPSAVLVARTEVVRAAEGFDARLRFGEDVDLVWRLVGAGHTVRYAPDVVVGHRPRPTLSGWFRQRVDYGSSAAPLATRHGDAVAPARFTPLGGVAAVLGLVDRRAAWFGSVVATAPIVGRLRDVPDGLPIAVDVARRSIIDQRSTSSRAIARAWWPLLLPWVGRRGVRQALVSAFAWSAADRIRSRPRHLDPVRAIGLAVADDLAYSVGVWRGAIRERSLRCLLPAVRGRQSSASSGAEVGGRDLA